MIIEKSSVSDENKINIPAIINRKIREKDVLTQSSNFFQTNVDRVGEGFAKSQQGASNDILILGLENMSVLG